MHEHCLSAFDRPHGLAVADSKEKSTLLTVRVLMKLAAGVNDESTWIHFSRGVVRRHRPPSLKAEVDFDGFGMGMIRTHLARFPARNGDVAVRIAAQNLLDVGVRSKFLLISEAV